MAEMYDISAQACIRLYSETWMDQRHKQFAAAILYQLNGGANGFGSELYNIAGPLPRKFKL